MPAENFKAWLGDQASCVVSSFVVALQNFSDEPYITLETLANYLRVSKKTMERRYLKGKLCKPDIEGGGGKAHQWKYQTIRPHLVREFNRQFPERWPGEEFAFRD